MEITRHTRKLRAMSLVSLIDIVFTIILFFMVAGHLEKYSPIEIDLPIADSGQLLDEGPIEVVLGSDGRIMVNDSILPPAQVPAALRRELAHNPQRIITIKADANLEANRLILLLEHIRAAGGVNLSIVTQSGMVGV